MREKKQYNRMGRSAGVAAAVILSLLVLAFLFSNRQDSFQQLHPEHGVLDVREIDFSNAVFTMQDGWAFYRDVLGTSEELDRLEPASPDESIPYGTYRLVMRARPEQYLVLGGYSFDYSTRVYINNREVLNVGVVSDHADTAVPRIDYMTLPLYTGADGEVEIVFQYANFVHKEGGSLPVLYLSTPENMDRMRRDNDLYSLVLGGSLCIFALYFLLSAAIQGEQKYFYLAFSCMLLGLRDQNFYVLHLLPPNYNWDLGYRLLVLMISLQLCFLLLLFGSLYPNVSSRKWTAGYMALFAGLSVLHFVLPTEQLTTLSAVAVYLSIPFFLYLFLGLVKQLVHVRKMYRDDVLILIGYALLFGSHIYEVLFERIIAAVTRSGAAPPYMLLFVFLIAGAISIQDNRRKKELEESRRRSDALKQLNLLKNDFLHQMAHELKTPLTVMSGYAQLTGWQIKQGGVDEKTEEYLNTISSEAQRLSALVSRLIDLANGTPRRIEMTQVDVSALLADAAGICRPMLQKNGNRLQVLSCENLYLYGNREMLLQMMINLTTNANKHTKNGLITYQAELCPPAAVSIHVSDTGSGMSQEDAAHIFEKGYSTDGGSGIGLPICRDVTQLHGGSISLEKSNADGTVFCVCIPQKKEETS